MSIKERLENKIYQLRLNEFIFVSESKSTNSIYINVCGFKVRISDHTKKNPFTGKIYYLDIAEEILNSITDIKDVLLDEGAEEEKVSAFAEELRKIANGINSKRKNLEKARLKKQEQSLLAIEQAEALLKSNSPELNSFRRKNGLLIIGRELSFYKFLKEKGIKIKKRDAYNLYREAIWSQEQELT